MAKLTSTASMGAALARFQREQDETRRLQEAEREEAKASRPAVKRAAEIAKDADHEGAGEVEYVDRGPIRVLTRDGLLWLVAKGRLSPALRDAAERYRHDYSVAHGGQLRVCIGERVSGGGTSDEAIEARVVAIRRLDEVREKALKHDSGLIWIVDEVAGKGSTIRDLADKDDYRSTVLEVEFRVACRLLARHYGLST